MAVQITVIGLGRVGLSVGLALAEHTDQLYRVGHDRDPGIMRDAQKTGAFDKTHLNLHAAVENAEIVLLAEPLEEALETLKLISETLQPETVVIEISTARAASSAAAAEVLPAECHYISLTPALNPTYLVETEEDLDQAHADLFQKSVVAIAAPQGTKEDAVKLAIDLAHLLGATPLFSDLYEMDGLMAAAGLLPKLCALGLTRTVTGRTGWVEGRKFAGADFARMTAPVLETGEGTLTPQSLLQNKENALRLLDEFAVGLQQLREMISDEDADELEAALDSARKERLQWWNERHSTEWDVSEREQMPGAKDMLTHMFVGSMFRKKNRKKDD